MWSVAAYQWTHVPSWLIWSVGWQPSGAESAFIKWTGQTLTIVCHDDSTIIILVIIIITTIIAQHTRGRSQGICISLNQCCCHRRLADDVDGCRSLRKQSITVLCDEASVNMTKLELWVPSQVVKELYISVQTYNLSHKRLTALRFYVPLDTE